MKKISRSDNPGATGKNCPTIAAIGMFLSETDEPTSEKLLEIIKEAFPTRWVATGSNEDEDLEGSGPNPIPRPRTIFDCVLVPARPRRPSKRPRSSTGPPRAGSASRAPVQSPPPIEVAKSLPAPTGNQGRPDDMDIDGTIMNQSPSNL